MEQFRVVDCAIVEKYHENRRIAYKIFENARNVFLIVREGDSYAIVANKKSNARYDVE